MDVTIPSYSKTERRQRLFWAEICPPGDHSPDAPERKASSGYVFARRTGLISAPMNASVRDLGVVLNCEGQSAALQRGPPREISLGVR
jgi:hypothetical protein